MAELTTILGQIDRIKEETSKLRKKLSTDTVTSGKKNFGLVLNSNDVKLADCVRALENITVYDSSSNFALKANASKVLNGYYNNVTITGSDIDGQITTTVKEIIADSRGPVSYLPSDDGADYYSEVKVSIDDSWIDATGTDATRLLVLTGAKFIGANKTVLTGTMTDNGTVSKTLSGTYTSYTIPKGYHSGSGTVSITTQLKTKNITTGTLEVTPDSGKVLTKVTINGPSSSSFSGGTIDGINITEVTVNSGYLSSNKTVTFDETSICNVLASI